MTSAVSIRDMTVTYDEFAALDHVSLDVAQGESFGIVGESRVNVLELNLALDAAKM